MRLPTLLLDLEDIPHSSITCYVDILLLWADSFTGNPELYLHDAVQDWTSELRALSLISSLSSKRPPNVKSALDLLTSRVFMAYHSISDPLAYKSEQTQIMCICSGPFSDPSGWAESSLLRVILDKRDACLGPWIPGRDSFEDELRAGY